MQVTPSNHQYRNIPTSSSKEAVAPLELAGNSTFDEPVYSTLNSISPAQNALNASLAAAALEKAGPQDLGVISRGAKGATLEEAMSKGVVNPADWLSESDVKLFEQTTGGTIVNGVIFDKNGNESNSEADADLVQALFDMRNYGTFDAEGNLATLKGDITAADFRGFIDHYRSNTGTFDMQTLQKAYEVLESAETSKI